jgi:hypothetical protein
MLTATFLSGEVTYKSYGQSKIFCLDGSIFSAH